MKWAVKPPKKADPDAEFVPFSRYNERMAKLRVEGRDWWALDWKPDGWVLHLTRPNPQSKRENAPTGTTQGAATSRLESEETT